MNAPTLPAELGGGGGGGGLDRRPGHCGGNCP